MATTPSSTGSISPDRHADLLRRAPFAFIGCDAAHRIQEWNEGAVRMFGHSAEEALGRSLEELLPPLGEPNGWDRWLSDESGVTQRWTHSRKGGGTVLCDWSRLQDAEEPHAGLCLFGHEAKIAGDEQARAYAALLQTVHDRLPLIAWWIDARGVFKYLGGEGLRRGNIDPALLLGTSMFDMYPHELVGYVHEALAGKPASFHNEAHGIAWENWAVPFANDQGDTVGAVGFSVDVTALRKAEEELRARLEIIESQQTAIQALSTPILQVWEGVLTLPMIGVVDSSRAAAVMTDLLEAVSRTQSRFAILDLTGVEMVDTRTAAYLLDLIRAVGLLGAEGVITGIRSSVAQTIVGLGVDLGNIRTLANLQAGLRYCIMQMAREAGGPPPSRWPLGRSGL